MMIRETRQKPHTRARAGESMVMVVVMLMVFFILGASVLTAASASSAASSARIIERQSYYYARAMLDVLDESLRSPSGALGNAFRGEVMRRLIASGETGRVTFTGDEDDPLLSLSPAFTGALANVDVTFAEDVKIICVGHAEATAGTGDQITKASIRLRKLDMTFTLTYRDIPTRMHVQYDCTCNYELVGGQGIWSNTWDIQQVG